MESVPWAVGFSLDCIPYTKLVTIMYFMRVERDVFLHEGVKSRDLPQEKIFHLPNKELLI